MESSLVRAPRESVLLRVDYKSAEALGWSYLTNLSSGGLFLRTEADIPVGTLLKLVVTFPELMAPLTVDAEVRWTGVELQTSSKGVGLAFQNVSAEIKSRLAQIVNCLKQPGAPLPVLPVNLDPVPLGRGIRVVLVASSEVIAAVFRHRINRVGKERGWAVDLILLKSTEKLAPVLAERRARMFIIDQDAISTLPELINTIRTDGRHARTPIVIVGKASVAEERHVAETLYLRKPISMKPLLGIIGLVGGQHAGGQL